MWTTMLHRSFLGNELVAYLMMAGLLLGGFLAVRIFQWLVIGQLERWAQRTSTVIDDFLISALRRALLPVLYYGVVYLALRSLTLNAGIDRALTFIGVVLITFASIRFLMQAIQFVLFSVWLPTRPDAANLERQIKALLPIVTILVWALGLVFLLDNLGFKVSTIIAGLGIGGVAVALASQAVLGDLFSYFAIMLDRPFELDDFIIVGDFMGTIEHIGIKTTRIRSLGGEQLVFSNKDLTDSRVRNYKRMQLRRVVFKLGVTYATPTEKLQKATEMIQDIIKKTPDTRFDRAHFFAYGDFNLVIEVVFYVLSADYNKYMDVQQTINLAIKEAFKKEGIEFAFPTQTVHLHRATA